MISRYLGLVKKADLPHAATIAPEVAAVNQAMRADALGDVKRVAGVGLGLGVGAAGLIALKNWLARPKMPSHSLDLSPQEIDLAYPQVEGHDVTPEEAALLKKHKLLADKEKAAAAGDPSPGLFSGRWLAGEAQKSKGTMPWYLPAVTLAGLGSAAGGAALVNWIAKKRRKAEQKNEMETAKKEYEEAMLGQYDPAATHRLLAPKEAASLDSLYDKCRQRGLLKEGADFNEILGGTTGGYLTLASLLAGGTGYGAYKYMQGRSKAKLLEDALKHRAAVRASQNPPEMFIHPVAVKKKKLTEEEGLPGAPTALPPGV